MSFPISQLYPLLLVLWAISFWCKSKVFRAALLISFGLHTIFLVRVGGRGIDNGGRERIIPFTFVQGADQTKERVTGEEIGLSPEDSKTAPEAPPRDYEADREARSPNKEKPTLPKDSRVERGLPRIEETSLLDFSTHPLADSYRQELQRMIAQHQKTPPEVLKEGFEGRVRVWFNLSRDGRLNRPVFVDKKIRSSHDVVNQAAKESVIAAAKHFPPFPEGVNRAEIWFYVHVDYSNVEFPGD